MLVWWGFVAEGGKVRAAAVDGRGEEIFVKESLVKDRQITNASRSLPA